MAEQHTRRQTEVEYKFLRQSTHHPISKMRYSAGALMIVFHVAFIILYGFFVGYKEYYSTDNGDGNGGGGRVYSHKTQIANQYSMFMDVHTMMFIGFGFLMSFLKRYGYGSVGFNFLIAAYVLEWSILIRGWLESSLLNNSAGTFEISISNLLVADFCAAAVLISFGAVIGKASLSQLVLMATVEVVVQSVNEYIGVNYLHAYDVGESIYVHVFGAYFGLAVAKILTGSKHIESSKESSHYHSDLFSMIGTIFLWLYWPSFNSATAQDEGQMRAIVNTYLSITASCITTFIVSMYVGKGRLNMVHIQNATLAGGVAVGAIADMAIQPFGAMVIGSIAGVISTLGFQYLTPVLNHGVIHDTCGVNNLHGMPGIISGIASAIVAALAKPENYHGNRMYVFYPSRIPTPNSTEYQNLSLINTEYHRGGMGRTAVMQGGYQIAALALTLGLALVSGIVTGYLMKLPIIEQIDEIEEMFDDEPNWTTPEDYSLKLTEVRVQQRDEEELQMHKLGTST